MASHPPRPCCYSGVQCEGEPKYKDSKISGEAAYIAEPFGNHIQSKRAIIYFSDIGGIWHNSRILADQFAAAGYLTVVCNYQGKVRKAGGAREDTIETPKTEKQRANLIQDTIKYLRDDRKATLIGAVGYCAGAPYVMQVLASKAVDVGFIAHPAGVTENALRKINGPLSIAAADEDVSFSQERRATTERILKEIGYPYQINLYSHVQHGFAVRRAVSTKAEVYAKKQAFIQAITWFQEHLLNGD